MSQHNPRPQGKPASTPGQAPATATPRPAAKRPASSPADRAREDALFLEAGLEPQQAASMGKDPEASASIIARKHPQAVVRLIGNALKRGQPMDLVAAKRVAGHLYDKGARLIDVFLRAKPRNDAILERCA